MLSLLMIVMIQSYLAIVRKQLTELFMSDMGTGRCLMRTLERHQAVLCDYTCRDNMDKECQPVTNEEDERRWMGVYRSQ